MNRAIVYYSIAFAMGCLSSLLICNSLLWGAVFSASFLLIMYITLERDYFTIVAVFLSLGMLAFKFYYSLSLPHTMLECRVMEKKTSYYVVSYRGRRLYLMDKAENLNIGERLTIKGNIKSEAIYERGVVGKIYPEVYVVRSVDYLTKVQLYKDNFYKELKGKLGEEDSALIMSLCFGDTSNLAKDQWEDFQTLGVLHAVSVSGFHLAIIYKLLERVCGIFPALLLSLGYTLFTGAKGPTLRAFIMILILKLASKFYKKYDGLSALSFSALIILLIKPYYVVDAGFILSYLSTLGILIYYKKICNRLYLLPGKINESLSLCISAQCFSLPFAAMNYGSFSPGFLVSNLLLLPVYSIIVVLGNLLLILKGFSPINYVLISALKFIMRSLNGIEQLILRASPKILYFNIGEVIMLCIVLSSLYFYYKGKKLVLRMPIVVAAAIVLWVIIKPPIVYGVRDGFRNYLILEKGVERILICADTGDKNQYIEYAKKKRISKTLLLPEDAGCLNGNARWGVYIPSGSKDMNKLSITIYYRGGRFIFKTSEVLNTSSCDENCDIIFLSYDNEKNFTKRIYVIGPLGVTSSKSMK